MKKLFTTLVFVSAQFFAIAQQKPNIIYILADDMGYGDLESYGQKYIKTPNLSRMAKEGVRFTDHYAGTSVCAPSRCALITGKHTGHCEIRGNMMEASGYGPSLTDSTKTVAELLKTAGYTTALIGKWGLGESGTTGDPNRQGFDFFYGYTDQILAHNHFPQFLIRNGKNEILKNEVKYLDSTQWHKGRGSYATKKEEYADELFTIEAIKFISENKSKPFFLYLPYIIPHDNGEALKDNKFEAPSQLDYAKKDWSKDEKDYAASITYLDTYIGQILDHLKKQGLDKNTLVIFTSDNGNEAIDMRFNSSGGLRGRKRDLYEGGMREPFIAWWPGKIPAGKVSNHVSGFWDFMPTACELAGVDPKSYATDGISYLPSLLGKDKQQKHDYIYFEFHEQGGKQSVREGNWKAVKLNVKTANPSPTELYDLSTDLSEKNNVAAKYPEIVSKMEKIMKEARTPNANFPLPFDPKQ